MKYIFFQANFCARCGNDLTTRSWWRPRVFCTECEQALRRYRTLKIVLFAFGIIMILFLIRNTRPTSLGIPQLAPVSALDATPQKNPAYQFEEEEKSFCGALTRTGTPCRRLVKPGERCRQHRQSKDRTIAF